MDARLRTNRCPRLPARPAGLSRSVAWLFVFVALFASFEILHPMADLLHEHAHCPAASEGVPAQGSHAGESSAQDAHGPVALGTVAPALCLQGVAIVLWGTARLPEAPFLEPRSPVPISA